MVGQLAAPLWVLAGLTALVAVGLLVVERLQSRDVARRDQAELLRRSARGVVRKERLPLVYEVSLDDLGVHRAVVDVEYVGRDRELDAARVLADRRPLLVVGHSMAGKSRMSAELIRRLYATAPILLPDTGTALTELVAAGAMPEKAVIWLDELDDFLVPSGLTVGLLDRLLATDNTVVATMRTSAYDSFRATEKHRPAGAKVIDRFAVVRLELKMTETERSKLSSQVPDTSLLAAVERYGLAEYVGGGPLALDRYLSGQSEQPIAVAWIRAAADWRRAGLIDDIPEAVARGLLEHYLPPHRIRDLREVDAATRGLDWACERLNETVALLYSIDGDLEVFDYLLDYLEREDEPLPEATWNAVFDAVAAAPDEAYRIGMLLVGEAGWNQAVRFFRISVEHGYAPARLWLSIVLTSIGEADESERWLSMVPTGSSAVETTHAWPSGTDQQETTTSAMLGLAELFYNLKDVIRAQHWFRTAAEGTGPSAADAMSSLGDMAAAHGRPDEAEHWYRKAIDNGLESSSAPLGRLLYERGDFSGAEDFLRRAADEGDSLAAQHLVQVLEERGAGGEAESWLRARALDYDIPAAYLLARFLTDRGRETESLPFLIQAAAAFHSEAMGELGYRYYMQNDREKAETWLRLGALSGSSAAGYNFTFLLMERGAVAESEEIFRMYADLSEPATMSAFGDLLTKAGQQDAAEPWFRQAADAGDPRAMLNLGTLAETRGDNAEAEHWYRLAATHGSPEAASHLDAAQTPDPPAED